TAVLYDFTLDEVGKSDDEAYMVKALKAGTPVFLAGRFLEKRQSVAKERPDFEELLKKTAVDLDNDGSVAIPSRFDHVMFPTSNLSQAAAGVCDISTPRSSDGILREYRLFS